MPSVFLGIFYATCSSFVTLVTAELLGADAGLGWYLNWEKSMMLYANVYAGLILMATICTIIITIVFRLKDRVLVWQKGVIKW
jgi:NitT/TauT family transport system permease protein